MIFRSRSSDSGTYTCEADNGYSSGKYFTTSVKTIQNKLRASPTILNNTTQYYIFVTGRDSIRIVVENVQISEQCEDNPHFANCKLIVRAQYCTNKYYAKFCCRSCTMAGQLRGGRGGRG